jgi:peptide/nickel transport system substrate-binding protein
MTYPWSCKPRSIVLSSLVLALVFVIACGSAAPPQAEQKEAVQEMPKQAMENEAPKEAMPKTDAPKEVVLPKRQAAAVAATMIPGAMAQPTAEPVTIPQGLYGGHINMIAYSDVRQRLIHQSAGLNHNFAPMFNTLIEWNPETDDLNDTRCDLCQSWSLAEDGVTYTFQLYPNATWWDGVPVTADDVVFSLESMVNPDQFPALKGRSTSTHCNAALYYETGNSRAIDDQTVEVVTQFPTGGFFPAIANQTCLMIPRHTVVDQGIAQGGKDMWALNGSGPFKFVDYVKEVSTEYEKNTNYFKEGRPYIDGMTQFVMLDSSRIIAAYKTGQILTSNQPLDNLTAREALLLTKEEDNLNFHIAGPIGMLYLLMNTSKAPFDRWEVRRAATLAIHSQSIIETLSGGLYPPGYTLPQGFWYSYSDEKYANMPGFRELNGQKHPDDLAEARALLKKAGLPQADSDDPLKITLTTRNCCGYPDIAVVVKQQLQEAFGWDITLKVMEPGAGADAYWAGDYQFAIQGGAIFANDPDAIFARYIRGTYPQWLGGGRGKYYAPPGLEELFDQQVREPDQEKRKAIVHKMGDIVEMHAANPYIFWWDRHHIVEERIQNYHYTYQNYHWEHVWCDPAC